MNIQILNNLKLIYLVKTNHKMKEEEILNKLLILFLAKNKF